MTAGRAKQLSCGFSNFPDSVFSVITSSLDELEDSADVLVAMGEKEENYVSFIQYVSERQGSNRAFNVSEGKTWFTAIVDTGCTEHLTSSKECLINFRRLPRTRIFKCANESNKADLSVNFCGDIEFENNDQPSMLRSVLYNPGLSFNILLVQ